MTPAEIPPATLAQARCAQAARNNAIWCDTVCRAHGLQAEWLPTAWRLRVPPPPFHSNLVFTDLSDRDTALALIRELQQNPPMPRWSLKDSYCRLDLGALGFAPLFDATWIWREAQAGPVPGGAGEHGVARVKTPDDLLRWEAAWAGDAGNAQADRRNTQFPCALLDDPNVVFLGAWRGADLVAGAIANRTGDVIGLSNLFGRTPDETRLAWPLLSGAAQQAFGGLALVGYERGDDLEQALACGFKAQGPLRVWGSEV